MPIALSKEPINAWQALEQHSAKLANRESGQFGATASFIGTMRSSAGAAKEGDAAVTSMWLEHYPGMTEAAMQQLTDQAQQRWPLLDVLLLHRVGEVLPNEVLVVIGVWSKHRAEAFAACEWLMEALKHNVPLWKKERTADGDSWVASNTLGRKAQTDGGFAEDVE